VVGRDGCGAIFPDTIRVDGRAWSKCCPDCNGRRRSQQARARQRAKIRGAKDWAKRRSVAR
jgi:hypothetical protein